MTSWRIDAFNIWKDMVSRIGQMSIMKNQTFKIFHIILHQTVSQNTKV